MKKIPTLFKREFINNHKVKTLNEITEGMEWVMDGKGIATVKWDGSCCAIIGGELYKRYDAKNGKPVPEGAIKCQEKADEITGHLPCWVKCDRNNPADKWFWAAYEKYFQSARKLDDIDRTYEAIGRHFHGNAYGYDYDTLIPHGENVIEVERSFDGIRQFLSENYIEGIVFWLDGEPKCKIKRSDFGFVWNERGRDEISV